VENYRKKRQLIIYLEDYKKMPNCLEKSVLRILYLVELMILENANDNIL
jgi:hypothetical protein